MPSPDGAACPDCGAGPFISTTFYERHWHQLHDPELATDDDAEGLIGQGAGWFDGPTTTAQPTVQP